MITSFFNRSFLKNNFVVWRFEDLLNKWHETKNEKDMNGTCKEKKLYNGHVRTWKEPQKSMKFGDSGGHEAV